MNISYDEEIDYELKFENLNLEVLEKKFEEVGKKLTKEKLLNFKLLRQYEKEMSISRGLGIILGLYENCEIKCARFKGENMSYFVDKKEFNGNIKGLENFLTNHLNLRSEFEGFQRKDILEIPLLALREALINVVVHRDYSNQVRDIKVAIYDNVVEIVSPSCLPNTLTVEEIYSGRSEIRNRILARVFKKIDYIEKWGSGFKRIHDLCKESGISETPIVRETGDSVSITFKREKSTGKISDKNQEEKILAAIETAGNISSRGVEVLLKIKEARARTILKIMTENNLIERRGKGRITHYIKKIKEFTWS